MVKSSSSSIALQLHSEKNIMFLFSGVPEQTKVNYLGSPFFPPTDTLNEQQSIPGVFALPDSSNLTLLFPEYISSQSCHGLWVLTLGCCECDCATVWLRCAPPAVVNHSHSSQSLQSQQNNCDTFLKRLSALCGYMCLLDFLLVFHDFLRLIL